MSKLASEVNLLTEFPPVDSEGLYYCYAFDGADSTIRFGVICVGAHSRNDGGYLLCYCLDVQDGVSRPRWRSVEQAPPAPWRRPRRAAAFRSDRLGNDDTECSLQRVSLSLSL